MEQNKIDTTFKDMLKTILIKRWYITALVLSSFILIIGAIFAAILLKTPMVGEWKELLLLLLGAFIGSYGKIIDFWYTDQDRDKMLVQKADEEDGITLSNAMDKESTPVIQPVISKGVEIDEDGDGVMDGLDFDNDGIIDEYFEHRQCEHVWGDEDGDGVIECLKCGKIKED